MGRNSARDLPAISGKERLAKGISLILPQYKNEVLSYMTDETFVSFIESVQVRRKIVEFNLIPSRAERLESLMKERHPEGGSLPHRRNSRSWRWGKG